MSSEDSGEDQGSEVLIVRPIPWRSTYCATMFEKIDKFTTNLKSPMSRRQAKKKLIGSQSTRPLTEATMREAPEWAIQDPSEADANSQ